MAMGEPKICQCGGLMPGVSSLPGAAYNEGFVAGVRAAEAHGPSGSSTEGQVLVARTDLEAVARSFEAKAREQSDEFGNFVTGEDGVSGSYKEGQFDAFFDAARDLRAALASTGEGGRQ